MKFNNLIVGASIAVIAGCIGFTVRFLLGGSLALAAGIFIVTLLLLIIVQTLLSNMAERRQNARETADLADTVGHCMRQVSTLNRRLDDLHSDVSSRVDSETESLKSEVALVVQAVRELADVLEDRTSPRQEPETELPQSAPPRQAPLRQPLEATARKPSVSPVAGTAPVLQPLPDLDGVVPERPVAEANRPPAANRQPDEPRRSQPAEASRSGAGRLRQAGAAPVSDLGPHVIAEGALEEGRADIFLQPIVTLPQRKVQYYEAVTRLRTLSSGFLEPAEWRPTIVARPSVLVFDRLALDRSLMIASRLSGRGRDVKIFMPLAHRSIADGGFLSAAEAALTANPNVAGSIVFEIDQKELAEFGPVEDAALAALGELGARFAVDGATSFRFEAADLSSRLFRYVRVAAGDLIDGAGIVSDIHPADLSGLLARSGLKLIATGLAEERQVVDLLDYDIPYAQGNLFSAPRPVRADVLRTEADGDTGVRASA